jgi:hypothetical protein
MNYSDLDDSEKVQVQRAVQKFMYALDNMFDTKMSFENIKDIVQFNDAIVDDMMLSFLKNGNLGDTIRFPVQHQTNRVAFIKAIRKYTNWGLYEAKQFADSFYIGNSTGNAITDNYLTLDPSIINDAVKEFRSIGIECD